MILQKSFFLIISLWNILQKLYSVLYVSGEIWESTNVKSLILASKNINLYKGIMVGREKNKMKSEEDKHWINW